MDSIPSSEGLTDWPFMSSKCLPVPRAASFTCTFEGYFWRMCIMHKSFIFCHGPFFPRRSRTFEDCVSWARMRFQDYYYNRVAQVSLDPDLPGCMLQSSVTPHVVLC
eukprot:1085257-Pelagomonas_calceolata.AAC.1